MESYFVSQTSDKEPIELWTILEDNSRFYILYMMSLAIEDERPHMHKLPSGTGG